MAQCAPVPRRYNAEIHKSCLRIRRRRPGGKTGSFEIRLKPCIAASFRQKLYAEAEIVPARYFPDIGMGKGRLFFDVHEVIQSGYFVLQQPMEVQDVAVLAKHGKLLEGLLALRLRQPVTSRAVYGFSWVNRSGENIAGFKGLLERNVGKGVFLQVVVIRHVPIYRIDRVLQRFDFSLQIFLVLR